MLFITGKHMTFEEFMNSVDNYYHANAFTLRYGQTIMNMLHKEWREKYDEIIDSDLDCFYDDGTIRFTLDQLQKDWINRKY